MIRNFKKIIYYSILTLVGIISIGPFFWLLSTSFKGAEEIFSYPPQLIPTNPTLENYSGVWNTVPFDSYFFNSIIIVVFTILINLIISSMAGFALARFNFKFKGLFFFLILASMMIPKEIIIIPVYLTILKMSLADTLAGVFLPFAVEGFSIFMMRQAFLALPKELEEAALMDGCGYFKLFFKVLLPLTKPTLATLTIFTFIGSWGDFLWPMIVLKSPENYTLQVGLSFMLGTFVNNFRYVAAGVILATLPVILVFIFSQKYFEKGLFAGIGK